VAEEAVQDQIFFTMVAGERRLVKSVPEGQGERVLREIIESDSRWIEVDDSTWIVRENVLYAHVSLGGLSPLTAV
jgi:hypothetical protein